MRACETERQLYRSRNGMIFGVCRGIAEYLNVSVFWTRVLAVICLLCTCFWAFVGYVVAALLMKPEPVLPLETDGEREFYHSYTGSRTLALQRLKNKFDQLDRRIQRMEHVVTSPEYDWDKRLNS